MDGSAIYEPVNLFRNIGVVVLCVAGFYWWRVSFGKERDAHADLKQAAFFTALGFFAFGLSLISQAF